MFQYLLQAVCGIVAFQGTQVASLAVLPNHFDRYFEQNACPTMVKERGISLYPHEEKKMVCYLDYQFPQTVIEHEEDLKTWWTYHVLHYLFGQRLERNARACQTLWIHPTPHPLGGNVGSFLIEESLAEDVLSFLIFEIEMLKEAGFYPGEFQGIKQTLQKKLQLGGASDEEKSDQERQFPHFYEASLPVLEDLQLDDVQAAMRDVFVDQNRILQIGYPKDSEKEWSISSVENVIKRASFAAEYARFLDKEENAQDEELEEILVRNDREQQGSYQHVNTAAFYHLPLSDHDKALIHSIITTVAEKSVMALPFKKGELEKKGKEVDAHVHPLRFLAYIIGDPHLKKCLKEIKRSSFKWDGFLHGSSSLKGFVGNMRKESQHHNVRQYIPGFCECLHQSEQEVMQYVDAHDWEGLVKYLIR